MPYISQERRKALWNDSLTDHNNHTMNAGELNYWFTYWIKEYIEKHGESYQTYNDIIGALEGCKLEVYRKFVGKYEDKKKKANGDIKLRNGY